MVGSVGRPRPLLELQVRFGDRPGGLRVPVGRLEAVHVDGRRLAGAQAGRFEQSGAFGPASLVLVADGCAGQQAAHVLRDDEARAKQADALRIVEPQAGARAPLEARALAGGGYGLTAEAAGHDVHVAERCPVDRRDVLQVRHVGPVVGEHGAWSRVDVGQGDDPRIAERVLDGQVEAAVAAEQRHHGRGHIGVFIHARGYASPVGIRESGFGWRRLGRRSIAPYIRFMMDNRKRMASKAMFVFCAFGVRFMLPFSVVCISYASCMQFVCISPPKPQT